MPQFWENDDTLEAARSLLAESADDLKARLLAQAMRLQESAEGHQSAMVGMAAYSPEVAAIANVLTKYPGLVEPVRQLITAKLTALMDSLPEDSTDG